MLIFTLWGLNSKSPEAIRQEIDCIFLDPETFLLGNDFSSFSWRNRLKRDPVLLLSYFYLSVVVFHPATAEEQKLKYQVGTGATLPLMNRLHSQSQTHKRPREYVPVGTKSKRYKTKMLNRHTYFFNIWSKGRRILSTT